MAMEVSMQRTMESTTGRARAGRSMPPTSALSGDLRSVSRLEFDAADLGRLSDSELESLARSWRAKALRGAREANGPAHACEAMLRQRKGSAWGTGPELDLRPLADWEDARPWWQLW